jgi:hypothetical protein
MRHERSGSSRTSSDGRHASLLVRVIVLGWATAVYVAYWLRHLPAAR